MCKSSGTTTSFFNNYADPVLLASLQTTNGGNTAALRYRDLTGSGAQLRVQEEQSKDDETSHMNESVGYVVFENDTFLSETPAESDLVWSASAGTISEFGQYIAPIVKDDTQVTVTARHKSDSRDSDSYTFTVKADTVVIYNAPRRPLIGGKRFNFNAYRRDLKGITWRLQSSTGNVGTINEFGVYEAPIVSKDTSFYIDAASNSNPSVYDRIYFSVKAAELEITKGPGRIASGTSFALEAATSDRQGVTWRTVSSNKDYGSITADGIYTAPIVSKETSVYVDAVSISNPSLYKRQYFTITPEDVTISRTPSAALESASTFQFEAVTGDPAGVTWALPNSNRYYGTIDENGFYTAPIPSNDISVYVDAISKTNPAIRDRIYFTVKSEAVSITNAPSQTLSSGATFDFDATTVDPQGFIWKLPNSRYVDYGTIDETGVYTAPVVASDLAAYVIAESVTNPAIEDRIYFTVQADAVEIANAPTKSLSATETFDFDALVKDPAGFTWRLKPDTRYTKYGRIDENGVYTAPIWPSDLPVYVDAVSKTNPAAYDRIHFTVKNDAIEIANAPQQALGSNETFDFDALVKDPAGITWRIPKDTRYTKYGSITQDGVYTSPIEPSDRTPYIDAVSVTNPDVYDRIWFTVENDAVEITNAPITGIETGGSFDFDVFTKDPLGVTWRMPSDTRYTKYGSIDENGVYRAPIGNTRDVSVYVDAVSKTNPKVYDRINFFVRKLEVRAVDSPTYIDSDDTYQLTSEVEFDALDQGVTWSATHGTIDENAVYRAPILDADTEVTLTATSVTSPGIKSTKKFRVKAIEVVTTEAPQSVSSGSSYNFRAKALFDGQDRGVTWAANLGSVDGNGTYVAPHLTEEATVTITATSVSNPNKFTTYSFPVTPYASDPTVGAVGSSIYLETQATSDVGANLDWIRKTDYEYDRDNRVVLETLTGRDGDSYSYKPVSTESSYDMYGAVRVNGQLFEVPRQVTRKTLVDGTELKDTYTLDKFNLSGFLSSSVRRSESQVTTTSYGYHTGSSAAVFLPKLDGELGSSVQAKQYADLVSKVTIEGLSETSFLYDSLGHIAQETQTGAFVSAWNGVTPTTSDRVTTSAYDGFGQLVWTHVAGGGVTASKSMNTYYDSGELKTSWDGYSTNLTTYTYSKTSSASSFGAA